MCMNNAGTLSNDEDSERQNDNGRMNNVRMCNKAGVRRQRLSCAIEAADCGNRDGLRSTCDLVSSNLFRSCQCAQGEDQHGHGVSVVEGGQLKFQIRELQQKSELAISEKTPYPHSITVTALRISAPRK